MAASPVFAQTATPARAQGLLATPDQPDLAKGPTPDPCATSLVQSQTTICQGGTAVLTVNTGCFYGPYTYTWSPNQDISSNSHRVVVNPLVTTTYTVVATSPDFPTLTFSATVNVLPNCCQQSTAANIIQLNNVYEYTPGQPNNNDPFQGQPSGTTFHVTGDLTLKAQFRSPSAISRFVMPPGTVLLMDAGASVIVRQGARLEMNGSTITAACNEMWGGLRIEGTSEQLDMHGVAAGGGTVGYSTMRNRIMHSQQGIVLEDGGPEFQINHTNFLHNLNSLDIDRRTTPFRHYPLNGGVVDNKIVYSTFDSDPELMKSPYNYNLSTGQYYYTDTHIRVAGNLSGTHSEMGFRGNTLSNSLFGIKADRTSTPLRILNSTFENFLLAGIHYGSLTGPLTSVTSADELIVGRDTYLHDAPCTFRFRPYGPLPSTSQINAATSQYANSIFYGMTGISTSTAPTALRVTVANSLFEQQYPGDYSQYMPTPSWQTGISASTLTDVSRNRFTDLRLGIAHNLPANATGNSIIGNLFAGCGFGYAILNNFGVGGTSQATAGTVTQGCNTYARTTNLSYNSGQYYGIFVNSNAFARITGNGQNGLLTNRFEDGGLGASRFQAIYSGNSSQPFVYDTFDDYRINTLASLIGGNVSLTQHMPGIIYPNNNTTCAPTGTPYGLQRGTSQTGAATSASVHQTILEQNAPNPAHGATRIDYALAAGAQEAKLLVRRALDGRIVATVPLNTAEKSQVLDLDAYPSGTYFYTLLVDGTPAATRRLVVE